MLLRQGKNLPVSAPASQSPNGRRGFAVSITRPFFESNKHYFTLTMRQIHINAV